MSSLGFIPSVLVVDDFATMRRIIRTQLEELGFRDISDAKDGAHALRLIGDRDFHLIISDWNMEPMSGIDFLRRVRKINKYKKTPFIMVTAESKVENVREARKAGVSNYIIKPFSAAMLRQKIAESFAA